MNLVLSVSYYHYDVTNVCIIYIYICIVLHESGLSQSKQGNLDGRTLVLTEKYLTALYFINLLLVNSPITSPYIFSVNLYFCYTYKVGHQQRRRRSTL